MSKRYFSIVAVEKDFFPTLYKERTERLKTDKEKSDERVKPIMDALRRAMTSADTKD